MEICEEKKCCSFQRIEVFFSFRFLKKFITFAIVEVGRWLPLEYTQMDIIKRVRAPTVVTLPTAQTDSDDLDAW